MNNYQDANLNIDPIALRVYRNDEEIRITLLEWRILLALLQIYPEHLTIKELERVVYNRKDHWSFSGIYTYISRLRSLIGAQYIWKESEGYRFYDLRKVGG